MVAALALCLGACGSAAPNQGSALRTEPVSSTNEPVSAPAVTPPPQPEPLVGIVAREQVLAGFARWSAAFATATADAEPSRALGSVRPGAHVTIYFGTWCGDSIREVTRLWKAFDQAGPLPFEVKLVAVDRAKTAPGFTETANLRYVPTIVVERNGHEVGRIIESAPGGIERALLGLLNGSQTGIISGRSDL